SMLKPLRFAVTLCFLLSAVLSFAADRSSDTPAVNIPFSFEVNRGQTAPQVKYLARSPEGVLFFTDQGVTVAVPKVGAFRMLFDGASTAQISAEQQLAARSNYLTPKSGVAITGVENYQALRYAGVYPGIDVRFYGHSQHLEHDFELAPGSDAATIALRFEVIDHLELAPSGTAELKLGNAILRETQPVAWQMVNGKSVAIAARWKVIDKDRLGIALG